MTIESSKHVTGTVQVSTDFFGVVGVGLQTALLSSRRDERRKAFRQLTELCKIAGLIENKDTVLYISVGSNHVGQSLFILSLSGGNPGPQVPANNFSTLS